MTYAIGIDVGTTNLKVALGRRRRDRSIGSAQRPLAIERGPGHRRAGRGGRCGTSSSTRCARSRPRIPPRHADVAALGVCSQYSSIVPVDARRATRRADAHVAGPARHRPLVRDHGPRRGRVHDVRRAARHPADRQRAVARAHPLHCSSTAPTCTRATAAYLEAMDYVTARLTGRITAIAAHVVHGAVLRQPLARRDRRTTTSSLQLAGRRRDPAARRSSASTPTIGPLLPDVAAALGLPAVRDVVYARHQRHRDASRSRPARSRPGRAGLSIGTTSVLVDERRRLPHRPRAPDPRRCRARTSTATSCARRTASAARSLEHVLEQRRLRAPTSSATTGSRRSVRRARRRARRDRRRRGRRDVPPVARTGRSRRSRAASIRGGFVNMSLETTRARPRARGRRRRRAQPGVAPPARRDVHRQRASTRSCSWAARPARRRGARCSPTCSTGRSSPLAAPDGAVGAGDGAARAATPRRDLARRPRPRAVGGRRHLRARPGRHAALRGPSGPVRGCVRGPPPDQ